jgi:hypothetical protein
MEPVIRSDGASEPGFSAEELPKLDFEAEETMEPAIRVDGAPE